MKRVHAMPFGAEMQDDGVRFRLWAPGAEQVALCLDERELPMQAESEGWFQLSAEAAPGSLYRYRIDGGSYVPDPASRCNPQDVHGPSEVVDPSAFDWQDQDWRGRPWEEVVVYELHVGSFSAEGDFAAVERRLDALAELGVTAIELMPLADFPGRRNWGYDGVLPFAPDGAYGRPDELKRLVQAAHARGLMMFLDVVYNHFGPEGNYLHVYAPQFFTERHQTPWGAAINFDGKHSRAVREFFIHNALYWLEEYHFDGLRFDAVHAVRDDSHPDIFEELAERVRDGPGSERHVHLVLENDANTARYLRDGYDAQWNDDIHHAYHVLLSGEQDGYYRDYADQPLWRLGRCLTEGFAYQGEPSAYRDGEPRGEPSTDLPATRFVDFLQNHDQIGNRAFGERLTELAAPEALRAATAILLLAPSPPLLFMGQEWGSRQRFPFFCDFGPELAQAVTEGRRREFERFERFRDPIVRDTIPDPSDPATFEAAVLDWHARDEAEYRDWLRLHRELLGRRQRRLMPRLKGMGAESRFELLDMSGCILPADLSPPTCRVGDPAANLSGASPSFGASRPAAAPTGELADTKASGLLCEWRLGDGSLYRLIANLSAETLPHGLPSGEEVYYSHAPAAALPPWSVYWQLESGRV